jgi:hypothetical protein
MQPPKSLTPQLKKPRHIQALKKYTQESHQQTSREILALKPSKKLKRGKGQKVAHNGETQRLLSFPSSYQKTLEYPKTGNQAG